MTGCKHAGVAQLVEHDVAIVVVVGSNPITRSFFLAGGPWAPRETGASLADVSHVGADAPGREMRGRVCMGTGASCLAGRPYPRTSRGSNSILITFRPTAMEDTDSKPEGQTVAEAEAPEEAEPKTDIKVEEVGPCKRKVELLIPPALIEKEMQEKLVELRDTVAVPGFRRGKAPLALLKKRFGTQLKDDVRESLLASQSQEAFDANDIKPLGAPQVDAGDLDAEEGFKITVTVNVKPTFEIKDYAELTVEKPKSEVTDEMVEQTIERMREEKAVLKPIGDEGLAAGDEFAGDVEITGEGIDPVTEDDVDIALDEPVVPGVDFENLAEQMAGAKEGDTVEVDATANDEFPVEEHRGKPVKVKITVLDAKRKTLPEADDEFAKIYRVDTMDDLRARIRERMKSEMDRNARGALRQSIENALLDQYDFDMPDDIVEGMAESIVQRTRRRMESQGMPPGEVEARAEEMRNMGEDQAQRQLKLYFILEAIAEKEHIYVTEDEVAQRIQLMAQVYNTPPARLEHELEEGGQLSSLRSEMRDGKTIDFLLEKANVVEVDPAQAESDDSDETEE